MATTTFTRSKGQWRFSTRAGNNEIIGGSAGETYVRLDGAINGFLSLRGHSGWKPGDALPEGYTKEPTIDKDIYILSHE